MNEIYEFLKACGTYYLATVEGDQPRVRPFGTVDVFDGGLYIQTGLKKDVAKQILANPKIELCAFSEGRWVRLSARAVLDGRIEAQQHMLDGYPTLQGMYAAGDGNTAVFRLEDAVARICSFGAPEEVIRF